MKKRTVFILAFLLLLLPGCGIISIGYNYGDVYLRYTINSYATFSPAQKEIIGKEVDDYMRWHRTTMLPEYVSLLQKIKRAVQSGGVISKTDVDDFRSELRALYVKTLQTAIRPATKFLLTADAGQLDEMVLSFARENKKNRDKELAGNLEEYLDKRLARTTDFLENLVGDLSDSQLEKIRAESYKLPYATALYLQQREDNQARLIGLLRAKNNEEHIATYLSLWLTMPEKFRSPEEQMLLKDFENASDEMIANIYALLNERQRSRLVKSLDKYIDTFQDLMK